MSNFKKNLFPDSVSASQEKSEESSEDDSSTAKPIFKVEQVRKRDAKAASKNDSSEDLNFLNEPFVEDLQPIGET